MIQASDNFSVNTQKQLVERQRSTDLQQSENNNKRLSTQLSEQRLSTATTGASTEQQLQTDFKSDRKIVRVCVRKKKAGPFPEVPGNHYNCRYHLCQQLGSELVVGGV